MFKWIRYEKTFQPTQVQGTTSFDPKNGAKPRHYDIQARPYQSTIVGVETKILLNLTIRTIQGLRDRKT